MTQVNEAIPWVRCASGNVFLMEVFPYHVDGREPAVAQNIQKITIQTTGSNNCSAFGGESLTILTTLNCTIFIPRCNKTFEPWSHISF